jgi:hypothetical protein
LGARAWGFGLGAAGTLLLATGLGGCAGEPLGPLQPEVLNTPDAFELRAENVTGVSTTLSYQWSTVSNLARVRHSTTIAAGTGTVRITDAFGTEIYSRPLSPDLAEGTRIGSPGRWTITVALTGFSGALGIRVERVP